MLTLWEVGMGHGGVRRGEGAEGIRSTHVDCNTHGAELCS